MKRMLLVAVPAVVSVAVALAVLSSQEATSQSGAKYLGSNACKTCHADQHKEWLAMKHSKAFDVVKDRLMDKDEWTGRQCVECHTTGWGKPGGFADAAKDAEKLGGVGCEDCHGPGSEHRMAVMAAMDEGKDRPDEIKIQKQILGSCQGCHNPHHDYAAKYKK